MLTYEHCGVSTDKNDYLVNKIKNITNISTGFADVKVIPGYNKYLVQSMDGVGTKIQLAKFDDSLYDTIGQDLVAMCVNDLICTGATPHYFQDYIGMNSLNEKIVSRIIKSIHNSCIECGTVITGGELAEMPDSYTHETPELIGCVTGFCDGRHLINTNKVKEGNVILGLESSGPHSNGFSLIRKLYSALSKESKTAVVKPTIVYKDVLNYHNKYPTDINAIANITGGGLLTNLNRVIPKGLEANIYYNNIVIPELYLEMQSIGDLNVNSVWSTFNMGIGMCLIVDEQCIDSIATNLPVLILGDISSVG